jgi:adenylate cyclase
VSENLQPAEVMEWMNTYLQSLARYIETRDRFINKCMGDAIMAVFGFPQALTGAADVRQDGCNIVRVARTRADAPRNFQRAGSGSSYRLPVLGSADDKNTSST